MEELMQRQQGRKKEKRSQTGENDPEPDTRKAKVIFYTLVFFRVALWLVFAWALSCLHLGAPCFVLAVVLWVYAEPLQRAFVWAKRHLCPFGRSQEKK